MSVQIMKMWSKTLDLSPLLATSDRPLEQLVFGLAEFVVFEIFLVGWIPSGKLT